MTVTETVGGIPYCLVLGLVPGACGGLATFLWAVNKGHYKNNRHATKLSLELVGGGIVAAFVGVLLVSKPLEYWLLVCFAVGLTWGRLVQAIRERITAIVIAAIGRGGEASKEDRG